MKDQTIWSDKIQWIVADDNPDSPIECTMGQTHIYGDLKWKPRINTLRYNIAAALPHVTGDVIFIIENDDAYKPQYLETMLSFFNVAVLVGYCDVTYYSMKVRGFMEMN